MPINPIRIVAITKPTFDQDTMFHRFATRFVSGSFSLADHFASAETFRSTPPVPFNSRHVARIEIWMDDHRGIIPVRVPEATARMAPESAII
eukprot:3776641-Pleurochrysis_carterae.AAC.1